MSFPVRPLVDELQDSLPLEIVNAIKTVESYVGDSVDDWLTVKKEIMRTLPAPFRKCFSTRDSKTKKHHLNEMELDIVAFWQHLTGVQLVTHT